MRGGVLGRTLVLGTAGDLRTRAEDTDLGECFGTKQQALTW